MSIRRSIKIIATYPKLKLLEIIRQNKFGKGSWVAGSTIINHSTLGHYVYVGANCVINHANIGSYCSIAPGVQIGGMEHNYNGLTTCAHLSPDQKFGDVTIIEEDVWIGANVIVKQGVRIGRGAVVGACSFVTHDVEPYSVVYGIPSRFVKYRFSKQVINKLEESRYWEYLPAKSKQVLCKIKKGLVQQG